MNVNHINLHNAFYEVQSLEVGCAFEVVSHVIKMDKMCLHVLSIVIRCVHMIS